MGALPARINYEAANQAWTARAVGWLLADQADRRGSTPQQVVAVIERADVHDGSPLQENKEARQKRRFQMGIDAGLPMPDNDYAPMPRGIGALAKQEGITRQSFTEDVKAHIRRMNSR